MSLKWTPEASKAAAELMNEKSSLDYVLFTIPDPKKPQVVTETKGNGGRQAVFDLFSSEQSASKVLFGAFVVSAVDEKGSVMSVRRKLVHVTFAGQKVGIMTKGKLNSWSGPFRDPFPGCATYLQCLGGDNLDDLQESDLQATLMAAGGGATRFDFSNQTLRGSLDVPEQSAPAPAPAPIVATGKKFKKPVAPPKQQQEAAPPKKLTKTQTALQKMKAHKDAVKRTSTTNNNKTSPPPPPQPKEEPETKSSDPITPQIPNLPEDTEGLEFVMLLSTQSGSNQQANNMRSSQQILKSIGIEPTIIDGADPASKKKRDKLFRLSGVRGNYPQFFVVPKSNKDKDSQLQPQMEEEEEEEDVSQSFEAASFFGGFDVLNEKKQQGTLAAEIGLGSDDLAALAEEDDAAAATENKQANKKVILLISSMCNAKVMAEQNHAQAVIEGLMGSTDMDDETKKNRLELMDGCDQTLRERRNELWGVSGKRAEYPQLFTVDETSSEIQFVGDYDNIMYLHDSGSLAQQIGLWA